MLTINVIHYIIDVAKKTEELYKLQCLTFLQDDS